MGTVQVKAGTDGAMSLPAYEGTLMRWDGTESRYHARALGLVRPPDEIALARENEPFAELSDQADQLQEALRTKPEMVQDGLARGAEEVLRRLWPMLEEDQLGFRVSFSLDEEDDPSELDQFREKIVERNRSLGLTSQAGVLRGLFEGFAGTRTLLRQLRRKNLLMPHVVLSDKHLPQFLVTAPVWFVDSKRRINFDTEHMDPLPDEFVWYMARRLGTQRLADWYQLWNRRSRPFSLYRGDAIPANLLGTIAVGKEVFDYIVIATPYHDVASKEWADPNWQRLIDPYLLGFSARLPGVFFFLGRWSNTGLFPLAAEMVAHTMGYLQEHVQKIEVAFQHPYWAFPGSLEIENRSVRSLQIASMAQEALDAYRGIRLFSWLTEGRPEHPLVAAD